MHHSILRRRLAATAALALSGLVTTACLGSSSPGKGGAARTPAGATSHATDPSGRSGATTTTATPAAGAHLAPGSDPSVLPGPVLIADRGNNRLLIVDPAGNVTWEFPKAGDLAPGQTFRVPDDAFFTPDGGHIVVTQEDDFVISLIDVAARKIVWRYGQPGVHGSTPGRLWNPDDAMVLPDGTVFTADIKNCRLLLIPPGGTAPVRALGRVRRPCKHAPPDRYGSPNGAFPLANGHYLVTEINGDWIDEIDLSGKVFWSTHAPGVRYPSDTNEVRPGVFVTVDYGKPGAIVMFDQRGKALWTYKPTGAAALDKPSLAFALPNGDVLCNDDFNHRVIAVDPRTDRIVWQYGVTGEPGSGPGHLRIPDGMDLVPPRSLLITHAATMGRPTGAAS